MDTGTPLLIGVHHRCHSLTAICDVTCPIFCRPISGPQPFPNPSSPNRRYGHHRFNPIPVLPDRHPGLPTFWQPKKERPVDRTVHSCRRHQIVAGGFRLSPKHTRDRTCRALLRALWSTSPPELFTRNEITQNGQSL